ncbi:hypothetical protein [Thermus neutrinimicus]|uniref:hypothetical protein n=1 Tax=Thermus neutrinimicus TaxID=2908149 RepID=UPI001FAA7DB9|nr:hypothetical protein [Thermus neutrinimicus]
MVLAWGVYPSPTAAVDRAALEVWERAKAYIQERRGGLPRAIVHHDQGGAFLSHEWVGQLLLGDGQRGNPVMESFFSRGKVRALPVTKWENRDLFLAVPLGCRGPKAAKDLTELREVISALPLKNHLYSP